MYRKAPEGKALQRALLQYYEPRNAEKVVKALRKTGREDLIPLLAPTWKPRREKSTSAPAPRGRNDRQGRSVQQGRFTPNSKPPRKGRK